VKPSAAEKARPLNEPATPSGEPASHDLDAMALLMIGRNAGAVPPGLVSLEADNDTVATPPSPISVGLLSVGLLTVDFERVGGDARRASRPGGRVGAGGAIQPAILR